jgi:hypothetical protein
MKWGIMSGNLDQSLPYAIPITYVCKNADFPIAFAYAIAWHESIQGEVNGKWTASTVVSGDGGHGLFQLTSSYPEDWSNALANTEWALDEFLLPDVAVWVNEFGLSGEPLIKCVAASFNAGLGGAEAGHARGDVDLYDTDHYGARVLAIYQNIIATGRP